MLRLLASAAGLLISLAATPVPSGAQQLLTLDDALREARAANAVLPVAAYDTAFAAAQIREARGNLGPRLSIDGDLHGGTPAAYAGNDARLQLVATQPLYDGGALRAGVRVARAGSRSAGARFHVAERDLDLQVRAGFSVFLAIASELEFHRKGLARLQTYLAGIRSRQAAGQGVATDVLRTEVLLGVEQADAADAERRLDQARLGLNDLLGRDPLGPLDLAPLPPPSAPPGAEGEPWAQAPDILAATADREGAAARLSLVESERRPHLALVGDAGAQPVIGTNTGTGLNNGSGVGAELTLLLSFPLWDLGAYRARRDQAVILTQQAAGLETVARRQARLNWSRARTDAVARYREVEARAQTVHKAEDAYLSEETRYRGGAATALEVLDAYSAWIQASTAAASAELSFRVAEAELIRWGAP